MRNDNIMVSVCMITYNHENYIAQAIEGVLMQHINFSIELIIGEDYSTDNTRIICTEYKVKYPEIIKLRLPDKNLGMIPNFIANMEACSGKYIALCEGDDYWTDPYKLKKQVDFLEANDNFTLSFHNSVIIREGTKVKNKLFCPNGIPVISGIEDLIDKYYIPTASMIFRKDALEIPIWYNYIYNGDYALQLLLANKGKIHYLDEVMAVYRKQSGGLNAIVKNDFVIFQLIILFSYFNIHSNFKYHYLISQRLNRLNYEYINTIIAPKSIFEKLTLIKFYKKIIIKLYNHFFNAK